MSCGMCCVLRLQTFMETLQQARAEGSLNPSTLAVLGRCCTLFGLALVEAGAADLLEAGWMTGKLERRDIGFLLRCRPLSPAGSLEFRGQVAHLLAIVEAGAADYLKAGWSG